MKDQRQELPPSVHEMLAWITTTYELDVALLSRMFQVGRPTIRKWQSGGKIAGANATKIKSSYNYLSNSRRGAMHAGPTVWAAAGIRG